MASSEPQRCAARLAAGLGCEQLAAARAAAARWRELDPYSGDAALAAALVALKRYDLAEARKALTAWRDSGSAGSQDPLRFAELLAAGDRCHRGVPRVRRSAGGRGSHRRCAAGRRRGWRWRRRTCAWRARRAQRALKLDSGMIEAQVIVLRALSVQGEHDCGHRRRARPGSVAAAGRGCCSCWPTCSPRPIAMQDARRELAAPGAQRRPRASAAERRLIALDAARGRLRCGREAARAAAGRTRHHRAGPALSSRSWPSGAAMTRAPCRATACWPTAPLALTARAAAARLMIKHDEARERDGAAG